MKALTARCREIVILAAVAAIGIGGCNRQVSVGSTGSNDATVSTGAPAAVQGWLPLFDGRTLNGWRVYKGTSQPRGWSVKDGALTKDQATDDIITTEQLATSRVCRMAELRKSTAGTHRDPG